MERKQRIRRWQARNILDEPIPRQKLTWPQMTNDNLGSKNTSYVSLAILTMVIPTLAVC